MVSASRADANACRAEQALENIKLIVKGDLT
jgi:hypothetical protein